MNHKHAPLLLAMTALISCTSKAPQHEPASQLSTSSDACEALRSLELLDGSIVSAEIAPAGTAQVYGNPSPIPQHCKVHVRLNERMGIDEKPYAIGMELRLPEHWNDRFLFQGGGGTDGELRAAIGMTAVGKAPNALSLGYAVVSTDAGHLNEPGLEGPYLFGADPQARIDYGYNHIPVVTYAARALIEKFYGRKPAHSYFAGCSNGGRQGMMASQRFPELFDGIVVGAPAHRVTDASLDALAQTQLLASISPLASDGRPQLGAALSGSDMKALGDGIIRSCDALDGLVDGMVSHPAQCKFDPASVQCVGPANADCLPADKVSVVRQMFEGARDADGKPVYVRWAYDPGIDSPLWTMWKMGPADAMPPRAINATLVAGAMSHVFSTPPRMTSDLYGFMLNTRLDDLRQSFERREPPFVQSGMEAVNATSTDVSAFVSRGGKLIFFHGMADGIFAPQDTIDYVDALRQKYDRAESFARLYLVPGMAHCAGGPAFDSFDALTAVVNWVEKGEAPADLIAEGNPHSPFKGQSRPLCAHPSQATYKGGDVAAASSFRCE